MHTQDSHFKQKAKSRSDLAYLCTQQAKQTSLHGGQGTNQEHRLNMHTQDSHLNKKAKSRSDLSYQAEQQAKQTEPHNRQGDNQELRLSMHTQDTPDKSSG